MIKPGIYHDMSASTYFGDPCPEPSLSQSIAKVLIDKSPAHARLAHPHPQLCPFVTEDEPAEKYNSDQAIGNAAHAMLIGRGRDIAEAKFNNFTSKDAKQFRDEVGTLHGDGKIVILSKHLRRAAAMVNAVREAASLMTWDGVFCDGHGEVAIVWTECHPADQHQTEFWFRSLIDWKVNDTPVCYDYKSTGMSIAPHSLGHLIEKAGWHIQAAFHERGLDELEPDDAGRRKFRFIAQENYPPYAVVPVELDERWLTNGRKILRPAINTWQHCLATDRWPAYPLLPTTPDYPGHKEAALLSRELAVEHEAKSVKNRILTNLMGG